MCVLCMCVTHKRVGLAVDSAVINYSNQIKDTVSCTQSHWSAYTNIIIPLFTYHYHTYSKSGFSPLKEKNDKIDKIMLLLHKRQAKRTSLQKLQQMWVIHLLV